METLKFQRLRREATNMTHSLLHAATLRSLVHSVRQQISDCVISA